MPVYDGFGHDDSTINIIVVIIILLLYSMLVYHVTLTGVFLATPDFSLVTN